MTRSTTRHFSMVAVLFAAPAFGAPAQNQSDVAPPATAQTTAQSSQKVWTNDNIGGVGDGIDSTPATRSRTVSASRPKPVAMKGRNLKWYRDQITALQARIPPMNTQIAELQSALDGKAAGDGKISQRPRFAKIDQWPAELQELQARRQAIVYKIDALRDAGSPQRSSFEPAPLAVHQAEQPAGTSYPSRPW